MSRPTAARPADDDGQAIALLVASLAIVACIAAALATLSIRMIDRSRAQSAADAVALAGASSDRDAAVAVAESWDAEIVMYHELVKADGRLVTVRVRIGTVVATARASSTP